MILLILITLVPWVLALVLAAWGGYHLNHWLTRRVARDGQGERE